MKALKKIIRGLTKVELAAAGITFAVMVICYFISVINRNIIKGSMPWTEEMALYCMVYMSLLGMEVGLRDGTQVSVTAVTEKIKGTKIGKALYVVATIILIFFLFMMFRYGLALVSKQLTTGQTSPVMKIPMWILYLALPVSFGIAVFVQVVLLIGRLRGIPMDDITAVDAIADSFVGESDKIKDKGEA
jgi:C4-dicarboxylate transporter DctQ subunit